MIIKSGYGSALSTTDNSTAIVTASSYANTPRVVSNAVADYSGNIWVMSFDNASAGGDNITFYNRSTGNNWTDNGTFATTLNFASIGYPTIAKLSSAGTKLYGAFGLSGSLSQTALRG